MFQETSGSKSEKPRFVKWGLHIKKADGCSMPQKFVDMHIHTRASDGWLSPEEAVEKAKQAGLVAVGIADHDSVDGIEAALEAGEKFGVEVIPGVELSSERGTTEIHVLGYFIDWRDKELRVLLDTIQDVRKWRAREMVRKLQGLGLEITYDEVLAEAGGAAAICRPHIAQVMLKRGLIQNFQDAFDLYLRRDGPAYVKRHEMSPSDAIETIRKVGGIPVLAHPKFGGEDILPELVRHGLRGIEVYHSKHDPAEVTRFKRLAREHNLLMTGGTDSHGFDVLIGSVRVPYKLLENLKEQLKR